jgi:hypothetical protein
MIIIQVLGPSLIWVYKEELTSMRAQKSNKKPTDLKEA